MRHRLYPGCFFGKTLKSCEVAGFMLSESTYMPNTILPRHSHSRAYFCLVLQGAYTETYDNKNRVCKPSTVIFHPEGEAHADHFLDLGGRVFSFEIEPRCLERARHYSLKLDAPADFSTGAVAWLALRLYKEFRSPDEISPLLVEGLFLELMAEASRRGGRCGDDAHRKPPRWLAQVKDLIHAKFSESLSLTTIAESITIHPVHLAREFRRYYGCTVGDYIRRLRIEFACSEIASTNTPFFEIAAAAGFADHGHFSRTFRRLTGMTPAQYRASRRSR